jgi:hypothetical protein
MNTPITVDSWQQFCDSIYWADEKPFASMDFRGGQIVFCKIDEVMRFFEKLRLTSSLSGLEHLKSRNSGFRFFQNRGVVFL